MTTPEGPKDEPHYALPWADAQRVALRAGDWCFREGDPADACYRVVTGRVEIVRAIADTTLRLARVGPGQGFGELAMLTGEARTAGARAVRDSIVQRLDRATFEQHVVTNADLAHSLARALATIVRERETVDTRTARGQNSTIAIVAHDRHADVDAFAAALLDRLRAVTTTATIRTSETTATALGNVLDRAERDHHVVVLVAPPAPGDIPGGSPWERACVGQADRVLVLAAQPGRPGDHVWPAGAVELVTTGVVADGQRHRSLVGQLAPAAHHRVRPEKPADLDRLARDLAGTGIGLVLSGGGARGLAHLGALRALEEHDVIIDRVGGTSMGAIVAALVALEFDAGSIHARCHEELVQRRPFRDFTVPRVALLRTRRAQAMLDRLFGIAHIEDLVRPYFCVSADLVSGRAVVHESGSLVDAVAASISLPGMAPPRRDGNRLLVDGGVLDNLPVGAMRRVGVGCVVAVDVSGSLHLSPDGRAPSIIETLGRASVLGSTAMLAGQRAAADVLVTPTLDGIGIMDWPAFPRAVEAGYRATLSVLSDIDPPLGEGAHGMMS